MKHVATGLDYCTAFGMPPKKAACVPFNRLTLASGLKLPGDQMAGLISIFPQSIYYQLTKFAFGGEGGIRLEPIRLIRLWASTYC
jgi:hypothetical protein